MRPPLAAETIVGGMIRDRHVQDLVLGDFAEEWQDRFEVDGRADADRWYWRETVRTAPRLIRLWWRESPWHHIAVVVCIAMLRIVFESRFTFFLGTRLLALPALLFGALHVLGPRPPRRVTP